MNKTYKKRLTKRRKQIRIYLWLAGLTALASFVIINWGNGTRTYMDRLVSPVLAVERSEEDTRTIQEHVWDILNEEYGLPVDERITAMRIIACESKFDPYAIGDSGKSLGLWQVHEPDHKDKPGYSRACMLDTYCQTRFIMDNIYSKSYWYPWSCF